MFRTSVWPNGPWRVCFFSAPRYRSWLGRNTRYPQEVECVQGCHSLCTQPKHSMAEGQGICLGEPAFYHLKDPQTGGRRTWEGATLCKTRRKRHFSAWSPGIWVWGIWLSLADQHGAFRILVNMTMKQEWLKAFKNVEQSPVTWWQVSIWKDASAGHHGNCMVRWTCLDLTFQSPLRLPFSKQASVALHYLKELPSISFCFSSPTLVCDTRNQEHWLVWSLTQSTLTGPQHWRSWVFSDPGTPSIWA